MHTTNICEFKDGFVRADADIENNVIVEIKLTGEINSNPSDFLTILQKHLRGVELENKAVSNAINVFYLLGMKTENVTKDQLVGLIMGLAVKKEK